MKKLDIRLLRMIRHSKGQFISVTAIVAVALCTYILFSITSINIKTAVKDYYTMANVNDIQIQVMRVPDSALKELAQLEGVRDVQGRISVDVPMRVDNKDEKVNIRMVSIPGTGEKINKLYKHGNFSTHPGPTEAILIEQFALARNIKPGDIIAPYINGKVQSLRVTGIASNPEFIYLMENEQSLLPKPDKFGVAYVNENFAQSAFGFLGSYNEILITVKNQAEINDVVDRVEKSLDKYGVKRITKLKDQLSNNVLNQKMEGIDKMSNVLPVMFLFVAAIIIVILLSRTVSNDRITIGVLKALGYSNRNILSHYTKYALAIGFIGAVLGVAGGIALSKPLSEAFVSYFNIPFVRIVVYPAYIINAIILTSIFCIGSGLLGARTVLHIMPADSMRPEAPKSGKRILLERISFIWRRMTSNWKMVIRNIMRTKRRFMFLVFGLALTYAINVVPLYETDAIPMMFEKQYGEYQRMDYVVEFTRPLNEQAVNDLKHLISASRIESKLEYPFELKNGWLKKSASIVGVPKDTEFFIFKDIRNNNVLVPENSILLTEALAKALNVKAGDSIKIKSFLPGHEDVTVVVGSVVKQYLGSNAFMEINTMRRLLMDENMATGANIASSDDVKDKLKDIKNIASVRSMADIKNAFMEFMDTIALAVSFYLLFGGILGFAIIYNSTIIGISERKMEFASLRVMGMDKKDIFMMVSKENLLMALLAIIFGIPMGMGMINAMAQAFSSDMITLPPVYNPKVFFIAAVATLFFVAVAQMATWRKIYKLNFIDALKSRIS